ncbi:MAG: PAS domain S-box protein [Candidatus Zixiibacteriota bacterium]
MKPAGKHTPQDHRSDRAPDSLLGRLALRRQLNSIKVSRFAWPTLIVVTCTVIGILLISIEIAHETQSRKWEAEKGYLRLSDYKRSLEELVRSGFATLHAVDLLIDDPNPVAAQITLTSRLQVAPLPSYPNNSVHVLTDPSGALPERGCIITWDTAGACHASPHYRGEGSGDVCNADIFLSFRDDSTKQNDVAMDRHFNTVSGQVEVGLRLALPIKRDGKLVGMLGSFIPATAVSALLERGNYYEMVGLVSAQGDIIGCVDWPENSQRWVHQAATSGLLAQRDHGASEQTVIDGYTTEWLPITTSSRQRLWLIYQVDQDVSGQNPHSINRIAGRSAGILLFLLGLCVSYLVYQLNSRNRQLGKSIEEVVDRELALEGTISVLSATVESTDEGILAISNAGTLMNFNQRLMALWRLEGISNPFGSDGKSPALLAAQVENGDDFLNAEIASGDDSSQKAEVKTLYLRDGRVFEQTGYHHIVEGSRVGVIWTFRDITTRERADSAIRQHLHFLQVLIDALPDPVYYKDVRGQYLGCNKAFERVIGRKRDEIVGKTIIEVGGAPFGQQYYRYDAAMVHNHASQSYEGPLVYADGTTHQVVFNKAVFLNADGSLGGIVGTVIDITGRKQMELALRESESKYRTIFENANIGFAVLADAILDCNQAYCDMLGYTRSEIIGQTPIDLSPMLQSDGRSSSDVGEEMALRALQGNQPVYRWQHQRKDGTIIDCDVILTGTMLDGRMSIVACVRDVSDRQRAEEKLRASQIALQKSEQYFRRLIENSNDLTTVLGSDGTVKYISPSVKRLLGYEIHEVLGLSVLKFIHPDDQDTTINRIEKAFAGARRAPSLNLILLHKDGSHRAYECIGNAAFDPEGNPVLVVNSRDMTERTLAEQRISASEETYRRLFEDATDGIAVLDQAGRYLDVNAVWCNCFGYSREEAMGMPASVLRSTADQQRYREVFAKVISGTPVLYEWNLLRKDGTTIVMEVGAKLLSDGRVQAIYHDLTERIAAQEQIRKLSRAVEASPVSVVITDSRGLIEYVNPRFEELTGYNFAEAVGQNPRLLKSGIMPDALYTDMWTTISSGRHWHGDLCNRKKNGELYWEAASISAITDPQGRVTHYIGVKQDISERIKNDLEMRKLSAAVVQSANSVVIVEPTGVVNYVNPKFTAVHGYSAEEVIGKPIDVLMVSPAGKDAALEMWNAARAGRVWKGVVQVQSADGHKLWIRRVASPVYDSSHTIISILIVGEDITSEMQAQQKAMEQDKLAAVGVLAAGVSHEFKNYLGGIIGNASFALEELESGSQDSLALARETLSQIIGMSERANQVAMSLLTYSKARPEEFAATNLRPLVLNTINLVEKELRNRSIELITHFEDAPEVNVSASKIQQLLLNLLLNAEHAIQESGVISVALSSDTRNLYLRVGDTGCGIPQENLSRIFDPFFSTKGVWGKDKVVGTGMGLAICRNVAREHQGDLTVESTVGIGTTFTLRIPLAPELEQTDRHLSAPSARKFIVFSLDKGLMSRLFKDAAALGIELHSVDDFGKVSTDMLSNADLVLCDASFSAKIELARLTDACVAAEVPYVMVNCGAMEYQLSHLYEHALANFRELPELQRINAVVPQKVLQTPAV